MSKYTPGPWNTTGTQREEVRNSAGLLVCKARAGDARLIASAPELLNALKYMAATFDSGDVNDGEWVAIQIARDAIAKATGGEE